jgi:hypothetical protein
MTPPAKRVGKGEVGPEALSQRDLAILCDLSRVRLLTGRHVQRLHFHDGSPLTQARRSRSTLQRLSDGGWLVRLDRWVGGVHAGSASFTYGLSAKGQRLMRERGPAGGGRLRRPWEPSISFGNHVLAGSELYVRELETAGLLEEVQFESEPDCWRWWTGAAAERLVLKPDAYVRFAQGDYEHAVFIEVDMASQSRSVIHRKGLTYVEYFRTRIEHRRLGYFPKVLFITTDDPRRERIVDGLSGVDAENWQLF